MKNQGRLSLSVYIIQINRGSKDLLINSKQEQFIKDSGKVVLEMALVSRHGQMVQSILENGERIGLTERVDLFM